jgi:hypothetical protein
MVETSYCLFLDVLGYKGIVYNNAKKPDLIVKELVSIYESIATQLRTLLSWDINQRESIVKIRSFSDSIYLQCETIEPLIYTTCLLYNWCFHFYQNHNLLEEREPMLRCGIAKDWTVTFNDVGGIVTGQKDINFVGKGVAKAYETSERTGISGMRILISPEVFNDLHCKRIEENGKVYFITRFAMTNNINQLYVFKHLDRNRENEKIDCYELLWPFHSFLNDDFTCVDQLAKLKPTFKGEALKHYYETLELMYECFKLPLRKTKLAKVLEPQYEAKFKSLLSTKDEIMNITSNEVESRFKQAINKLREKDSWLLNQDVSERSIAHKLAEYLQTKFSEFNVDCEYDKDVDRESQRKSINVLYEKLNELERLTDKERQDYQVGNIIPKRVYPDIIIHKRGSNKNNLCVIELKKSTSTENSIYDEFKLSKYTVRDSDSWNYQIGFFLEIFTDGTMRDNLKRFENGINVLV